MPSTPNTHRSEHTTTRQGHTYGDAREAFS